MVDSPRTWDIDFQVEMGDWSRRKFLEALAAGTALPVVGGSLGCGDGAGCTSSTITGSATPAAATARPSSSDRSPEGKPLPDNAARVLRAACARLIPTDEAPGATEAGCFEYIDGMLQTIAFVHMYKYFIVGAVTLDRLAIMRIKKPFHGLGPAEQDDILTEFAAGVEIKRDMDTRQFFSHLLDFTLQGYLSHPRHGGNKGMVGWTLTDYHHHT